MLWRNTVGVGVNRQGCFAEYLVIPAFNAFKLSDAITDDVASILDPFGNATHTALSFNLVGEDVLITGAGPIGIMAVAIARHVGARHIVITDVNDYRLDLARKMGATKAVNVSRDTLDQTMTGLRCRAPSSAPPRPPPRRARVRPCRAASHPGPPKPRRAPRR